MPKEERVKELKERIVEPVQAATIQRTIAPTPLKTGETIYKACGNCHGANAQKAALNKSQIIQGWNAEKIADALNGYKEGSYGGAMKAVMNTQASKLSDSEIHLVSEYISKL
ncbi:c-type cytochrome [bacterium]|nr:c-type cytochrome [bacterium]MBU1993127.1 c-type cytochrome [bacterium]